MSFSSTKLTVCHIWRNSAIYRKSSFLAQVCATIRHGHKKCLDISHIEKLDFNSSLNELWLCESRLKRIPKLCNCESLQVLYIYGNMITRVENLDHLTRLEFLSLAQNQLTTTRGFENLAELSDLNIGANDIKCKFLNSTGAVGWAQFSMSSGRRRDLSASQRPVFLT